MHTHFDKLTEQTVTLVDKIFDIPKSKVDENYKNKSRVENWLNSTTHESTGYTPHELIKGTRPPRILEQLFDYPPESKKTDVSIKIRLGNKNLLSKGE